LQLQKHLLVRRVALALQNLLLLAQRLAVLLRANGVGELVSAVRVLAPEALLTLLQRLPAQVRSGRRVHSGRLVGELPKDARTTRHLALNKQDTAILSVRSLLSLRTQKRRFVAGKWAG